MMINDVLGGTFPINYGSRRDETDHIFCDPWSMITHNHFLKILWSMIMIGNHFTDHFPNCNYLILWYPLIEFAFWARMSQCHIVQLHSWMGNLSIPWFTSSWLRPWSRVESTNNKYSQKRYTKSKYMCIIIYM